MRIQDGQPGNAVSCPALVGQALAHTQAAMAALMHSGRHKGGASGVRAPAFCKQTISAHSVSAQKE
jgi:putative N-acetylmannosamine-6-phosphate epimerase